MTQNSHAHTAQVGRRKHPLMLKFFLGLATFGIYPAVQNCSSNSDRFVPEDSAFVAYEEGRATVIGSDNDGRRIEGSVVVREEGCIAVGDDCIPVRGVGQCNLEDGPLDIIVADGEVQSAICYGDLAEPTDVVTNESGNVVLPQNANNAVLVFAPETNGVAIEGDLSVDGNNVTLFGNGPDETVIDGNVELTGNNARIRGVTIKGDLTMDLNNLSAVLVRVEGNVIIQGNNAVLAGSVVFGDLRSGSNNHVLVDNRLRGNLDLTGGNYTCADNHRFNSDDFTYTLDTEPRGDLLACP